MTGMKRILYGIIGCLLIFSYRAESQTTNLTGAQILRSARSIYDQGRLHELPTLLEEALKKPNGFQSDVERVEAYKILVLTYIYLEEPQKADEAMLAILNTDHFFKYNDSDPIEFKNLYTKFRTYPVFSLGLRVGLNQTYINTIATHYVDARSVGYGVYNPKLGFNVALVFEKEFKQRFIANPELMFSTQAFNYFNDHVYINDVEGDELATIDHTITHSRIQLNVLGQYKLKAPKGNEIETFVPYLTFGPSVGYLMSSKIDGLTSVENRFEFAGTYDNTAQYKPLNVAIIAGGGIKYKMGAIYITGDLRYQYGLLNVVEGKNRQENSEENSRVRSELSYLNNDFSMQNAMFSVGIIYPYFQPKKLIR
jgi:hypothetical protein